MPIIKNIIVKISGLIKSEETILITSQIVIINKNKIGSKSPAFNLNPFLLDLNFNLATISEHTTIITVIKLKNTPRLTSSVKSTGRSRIKALMTRPTHDATTG